MKKLVSLFLAIMMIVSLVACQSSAPENSETVQPPGNESSPVEQMKAEDLERVRIGFLFSDFDTTALGKMVRKQVEAAADALNIEFIFVADNEVADDQINSLESVLASGVDGILIAPATVSIAPKIVKMCEEAKVPVMFCFRDVSYEPDVLEQIKDNPYYLGCTYEGELTAAYNMCKYASEIDKSNMGIIWFPAGSAITDNRHAGVKQALSEGLIKEASSWDIDITNPYNSLVEACEYFITSSAEEVESIFLIAGTLGGALTTSVLDRYGVSGDTVVVTFDQFEGMDQAFETGSLALAVCGHHTDALYALMVLYNEIVGTPLSDEPVSIECNYLYIAGMEDYELFSKYLNLEDVVYSKDDIVNMVGLLNPEFSLEGLKEIIAAYNIGLL